MRVGLGFDVHRFGGRDPVTLAGVVLPSDRGLEGTSDADVAAHAVADALLGAAALGDLGSYFPSSDSRWEGANSMGLLAEVVGMLADAGHEPGNVDLTVVSQSLRIAPHQAAMRTNLASALAIGVASVSVKATTTDHIGAIGRDEGIAAIAVVTIAEV